MPRAAAHRPDPGSESDRRRAEDLAQILAGLRCAQKTLSPKFFYDEHGAELFERITELPEYYPTRTELAIMRRHADEIAALVGSQASLIEFGSGSSTKTRILLESLERLAAYVPVDISREQLYAAAAQIAAEFPRIEVLPVAADFTRPFRLPQPAVMPLRNIVYFPGSTIGNFGPEAALDLLRVMHQEAAEDGALLIGVDLRKDRALLERAYNDAEGVTAAFNLNMLARLNREFGANFDTRAFAHRAVYAEEQGRIEMHLVSRREQTVRIAGETFRFREGETIRTECSYKYTLAQFAELASRAGFTVDTVWTDDDRLFSVQYCLRH